MLTHTLGFPRIGADRELKKAQEAFWKGEIDEQQLLSAAKRLRQHHWQLQQQQGIDLVPVGDFSLYDHMLDTTAMLGAVPQRYNWSGGNVDIKTYYQMARGDAGVKPMEMSKWFDTNYHYLVPEIAPKQSYKLSSSKLLDEVKEAKAAGIKNIKPVLVGPFTFLKLAKSTDDNHQPLDSIEKILPVYEQMLGELAKENIEWIQIDEPALVLDLNDKEKAAFKTAYQKLTKASGNAKLLLATYFEALLDNTALACQAGTDGLHIDLVHGKGQEDQVLKNLGKDQTLSLGVVNGRNIWRVEAKEAKKTIDKIVSKIGKQRVLIGSSCSLLHSPVDLDSEKELDGEIKNWLSFAKQKCQELRLVADIAEGQGGGKLLKENQAAWESRRSSERVNNKKVQQRISAITPDMSKRDSEFPQRKKAQQVLGLPLLPTTTIGSFPQTAEIRQTRRDFKKGAIDEAAYTKAMQGFIKEAVDHQHDLGLDVLVHGEPERNDMVEYFGEQLDGFAFTKFGWVQSYGSRCVKPPIIFGDVSRPKPMTTQWSKYAQSITDKKMKGMLTGPVTILAWSFVRDDQPEKETSKQVALAIRDEVNDLEKEGIKIIQVDEAALRETLPLRRAKWDEYLTWAVESFKLTTCGVQDKTQIHTHMCYSEFNDILDRIAEMDADVISVEASRSDMELLQAFEKFEYPNDIGPGVYDIHSPRVPSAEEMERLLDEALKVVPAQRLWINPDCGLKTRGWKETLESLQNMMTAANRIREKVGAIA